MAKERFQTFCGIHIILMARVIGYICLAIIGGIMFIGMFPRYFRRVDDSDYFMLLLEANFSALLLAGIHLKKRLLTIPFVLWVIFIILKVLASTAFFVWGLIMLLSDPKYDHGEPRIKLWPFDLYANHRNSIGMIIYNSLIFCFALISYIYTLKIAIYTYLYLKDEEQKLPLQMEHVYQIPNLGSKDHPKKDQLREIV